MPDLLIGALFVVVIFSPCLMAVLTHDSARESADEHHEHQR